MLTDSTGEGARLAPRRSWHPLVLWLGLAYRFAAGGASAPVRVIFARAPRLVLAHVLLMITAEYGLSLERRLRQLVRIFGARRMECAFCFDLETGLALRGRAIAESDLAGLAHWESSDRFDARERAALRFVDEVLTTGTASDETFATLRAHFSEREIVELSWLNAVGRYLTLQARPLRLPAAGLCVVPAANLTRPAPAARSAPPAGDAT